MSIVIGQAAVADAACNGADAGSVRHEIWTQAFLRRDVLLHFRTRPDGR